jgi:hypothetical protein
MNSKMEKIFAGYIPPSRPVSTALPVQPISAKPARTVFLPRSLPSGPQCLADLTRQPLSFMLGNHYAPDPLWCLVPSQTRPLPLLLATLHTGEIPATPRAKVFHPSLCELPVASPRPPPRLRTAGKPHCCRGVASSCCIGQSLSSLLNRYDAGTKHPVTMPRTTPLLPPSLLAPRAAPSSLQLPSPALRRHHVLARPCAPRGHHQPAPVQLTSSPTAYGQTPSASPPHNARPCCALLHVRALPSLYHRSELSPPSLPPSAGPCCPHTMRGYDRRPLPFVCPRPHCCLPPVSRPGRASPLFFTTSSVPSHLTPPLSPYAGPRASPEPRASPQPEGPAPSPSLSSGAVDYTGEFCPSVTRLPRC